MKKEKRKTAHKLIWSKIRYYQILNDITDDELAKYLGVSARTIRNYDHDASNLTLGHLDNFLYAVNIELSQLC